MSDLYRRTAGRGLAVALVLLIISIAGPARATDDAAGSDVRSAFDTSSQHVDARLECADAAGGIAFDIDLPADWRAWGNVKRIDPATGEVLTKLALFDFDNPADGRGMHVVIAGQPGWTVRAGIGFRDAQGADAGSILIAPKVACPAVLPQTGPEAPAAVPGDSGPTGAALVALVFIAIGSVFAMVATAALARRDRDAARQQSEWEADLARQRAAQRRYPPTAGPPEGFRHVPPVITAGKPRRARLADPGDKETR